MTPNTEVDESQMVTGDLIYFDAYTPESLVPTVTREENEKLYFIQTKAWVKVIDSIKLKANPVIISELDNEGFSFALERAGAATPEEMEYLVRSLGTLDFNGDGTMSIDLSGFEITEVQSIRRTSINLENVGGGVSIFQGSNIKTARFKTVYASDGIEIEDEHDCITIKGEHSFSQEDRKQLDMAHFHENKEILDGITASFTTEKDSQIDHNTSRINNLDNQYNQESNRSDQIETNVSNNTNKIENLESYMDSNSSKIQTLQGKSHTHTNKKILDDTTVSFTEEFENKIKNNGEIISLLEDNSHSHSNKSILDNTTAIFTVDIKESINNSKERINNLENNSHTHTNKAILNATTSSFTKSLKQQIETNSDNIEGLTSESHSHDNKSILDATNASYKISDKQQIITNEENINGLQATSHEHSNKSILDATTAIYTTAEKEKLGRLEDYFKGIFADADARDAAITNPTAGYYIKQNDTDSIWFYDGNYWLDSTTDNTGDMLASVYDPQKIAKDVYDRRNHTGLQNIDTIENLSDELYKKSNKSHVHNLEDINGLLDSLDTKIDKGSKFNINDITGLQNALNEKSDASNVYSVEDIEGLESYLNTKVDKSYVYSISEIDGLQTSLDNKSSKEQLDTLTNNLSGEIAKKSDINHRHKITDIDNLQTTLSSKTNQSETDTLMTTIEGKSDKDHKHEIADVNGLQERITYVNNRFQNIIVRGVYDNTTTMDSITTNGLHIWTKEPADKETIFSSGNTNDIWRLENGTWSTEYPYQNCSDVVLNIAGQRYAKSEDTWENLTTSIKKYKDFNTDLCEGFFTYKTSSDDIERVGSDGIVPFNTDNSVFNSGLNKIIFDGVNTFTLPKGFVYDIENGIGTTSYSSVSYYIMNQQTKEPIGIPGGQVSPSAGGSISVSQNACALIDLRNATEDMKIQSMVFDTTSNSTRPGIRGSASNNRSIPYMRIRQISSKGLTTIPSSSLAITNTGNEGDVLSKEKDGNASWTSQKTKTIGSISFNTRTVLNGGNPEFNNMQGVTLSLQQPDNKFRFIQINVTDPIFSQYDYITAVSNTGNPRSIQHFWTDSNDGKGPYYLSSVGRDNWIKNNWNVAFEDLNAQITFYGHNK